MADIHKILSNSGPYVKKDGFLGIGTDNPSSLLQVSGVNTVGRFVSSSTYVDLIFQNSGGTGGFLNFVNNTSFNLYVGGGSSSNNKMTVKSTGNVGINNSDPSNTLVLTKSSSGQGEHGLRL